MNTNILHRYVVVGIILLFIGGAAAPIADTNLAKSDDIVCRSCASQFKTDVGTLSGYVTDAAMNPIQGARVRVSFHNTYRENYSDTTGYYQVTDITICNCTKNATCSKEGYHPVSVSLAIGEHTTYDFVLSSKDSWLYVGGNGPNNYTKIQDAINDSQDGDTVFVYDDSAPYYENVIVHKSILLLGENSSTTIIDGVIGGDVVSVQADRVTIKEFSILYQCTYPSSDIAIHANHTTISHTILLSSNWYGISLHHCCDTHIVENHISNKYIGILLNASSCNNTITRNHILNNTYGMRIEMSFSNHIFYNTFVNNSIPASDDGNNTWNGEYPSAGNYWDTYTGTDTLWGENQDRNGSDGIGDSPLALPEGGSIDRYPLMEPYAMTRLAFELSLGGFGFGGAIRNVGTTTAFRVCWRGTFTGGFILIGKDTFRVMPKPLLPGEEAIVKVMVLGFGKTIFTMLFWADNAPLVSGNCTATVLLFFVIGIHPGMNYQLGNG